VVYSWQVQVAALGEALAREWAVSVAEALQRFPEAIGEGRQ
jgi:hypothetical protein